MLTGRRLATKRVTYKSVCGFDSRVFHSPTSDRRRRVSLEGIIMSTYSELVENNEAFEYIVRNTSVPEGLSMKFVKEQGPASTSDGAPGRTFSVSGPKADIVRALVFADLGLTRRQISTLAKCSVSRVSEVVWGLEHDHIEFPAIPLREEKPAADPKPGLTPQDEAPLPDNLGELLSASIAARKAEQAGEQPAAEDESGNE
jgi:hypothetical protein